MKFRDRIRFLCVEVGLRKTGFRNVQRIQAGESRRRARQVVRDVGDAVLALLAVADQLEEIIADMAEREQNDGDR